MSVLLAMAAFSLAMSISPGPVNMITLSIGANRGIRDAIPFVSGATIGFTLLLLLIGIGLGKMVIRLPYLMEGLCIIGTAFICYIGYKIAISDGSLTMKKDDLPNFRHGFLLQWLNPKAWGACLAGVTLFGSPDSHHSLYIFVSIYFVICFLGIGSWALIGDRAFVLLKNPQRISYFNRAMGSILILVALFMLYQQFYFS